MIRCRKSGAIMNTKASLIRLTAVLLIVLGWSLPAFCGEIHDAAKAGDLAKVKALLKENPELVLSKDKAGFTSLHWAAYKGYKNLAELLLANKADVNARDNDGWKPLHMAVHKDMAVLLLANNADINTTDNHYKRTPLHQAASSGAKDVVELLIAKGADVNAKANNGETPLHRAAEGGRKDAAKLLLAHGSKVNAKNRKGKTPLRVARRDSKEVAELLRQHGGHE
jgi:ankyrin repeat protein